MGASVSLLAGIVIGVVGGIIITIPLVFAKSWWERRKALRATKDKDIIKLIKSEVEVINENSKEEESGRTTRGEQLGGGEPVVEKPVKQREDKGSSDERSRVSVSNPSFTLRD